MAWSEYNNDWLKQVGQGIQQGDQLFQIFNQCLQGQVHAHHYTVKDGILFGKDRLVLLVGSEFRLQIIREFHTSKIGGHGGVSKTVARISYRFYWPRMQQDIRNFVRHYHICQQAKIDHALSSGLLQPLPIPQQIWEDIAMDFITHLPLSHGYSTIMVVVDRLSKFAHFIPLKSEFTSKIVAETFINSVVKIHGFPKTIVFDQERVFISFGNNFLKLRHTNQTIILMFRMIK